MKKFNFIALLCVICVSSLIAFNVPTHNDTTFSDTKLNITEPLQKYERISHVSADLTKSSLDKILIGKNVKEFSTEELEMLCKCCYEVPPNGIISKNINVSDACKHAHDPIISGLFD